MIETVVSQLLTRLVASSFDKLNENKSFVILKRLAHERISRELFWNLECSSNMRSNECSVYLSLMRTEAFDELVKLGAPMDDIFDAPIACLVGPPSHALSKQLRRRLKGINRLSQLLDRTYNRTWMLRHRVTHGLELGDMAYLRQLLKLSLSEAGKVRNAYVDDPRIAARNPDLSNTYLAPPDLPKSYYPDGDEVIW